MLFCRAMSAYAAFLGHQPAISLAELAATVPGFASPRILSERYNVAVFTGDDIPENFLDTLGGTVFLAKKLGDIESLKEIPTMLKNEFNNIKRGKVTFSFRTLGLPPPAVRELYRLSKDKLRGSGRPSRYVGSDKKPAPAVVLHQLKILNGKYGREIVIIQEEEKKPWIGRTVGAQNVAFYTKRDIQKPVRDTRTGLLPPKLAQVMLNFGLWAVKQTSPQLFKAASKDKKKDTAPVLTVYDPFCGTGVIPLECLLRRWPVLASDASAKGETGTTKNLDWMRKEWKILKSEVLSSVWKQDARKEFKLPKNMVPNVIVTETSLGPALHDKPTLKEVSKHKTAAESLEADFLKRVAHDLPGVPLVVTFPVWFHSKGHTRLEKIWTVIQKLGYKPTLPKGTKQFGIHASLLYRRPEQAVGREIVVLIPGKK